MKAHPLVEPDVRLSRRFVASAPFVLAAGSAAQARTPLQRVSSLDGPLELSVVAAGLETPWGLAFLPDGRMLVTERPGRLRLIDPSGRVSPALSGAPSVAAIRQGGLLDVAVAPDFASSRTVFLTLAERRGPDANSTSLYRARLNAAATGLESGRVIYRQDPAHRGGFHFGSRMVFDRTGHLFVTSGDRWDLSQESQNPGNTIAKIVRLTADGAPAPGNPGPAREGWNPFVWSIGHRNTQAAALQPSTGLLWIADHGPRGGDTLHIVRAGRNYGWPTISFGTHYDGRRVGPTEAPGLEQPLAHWSPTSIAPSGMTFYTGDLMPFWRGHAFIGTLAARRLVRLIIDGERYRGEERLLGELDQNIRDVRQGPDGALYLLTDAGADSRLLRLAPHGR